MKLTSLGLKKPDRTDPVNVGDLNDNADLMNQELLKRPEKNGEAGDMTVSFTEPQSLTEPNSGENLKGIIGKLKLTVRNTLSILRLLGTTDISAIGGGTVTGAVAQLNSNLATARNVKLVLPGGDGVLSDQIYAYWSQVPIGYGCIQVSNGTTVRSGTYIKYSEAIGSITINRADIHSVSIWTLCNGIYKLVSDDWVVLTPMCTFYVTVNTSGAYASWIKYNPVTRELKGVIETESEVTNQKIIVDFPAVLPGLTGANAFAGLCGVGTTGTNRVNPDLRIMPRVMGGAIISSHSRDEVAHGATYIISFIAQ